MDEPEQHREEKPLLVVVLGPTGSGKTALSLALAERFSKQLPAIAPERRAEIVSCDSIAAYREFEIGAAKPSLEERARVQHHLIDIVCPRELFTAGDYARQARQALADITARGHLPIVVGGTGLYLRALLEGLSAGPHRRPELRERLRETAERVGPAYVHRILHRLDPAMAARIHPNDLPKVVRAIELCLHAACVQQNSRRRSMSEQLALGRDPLTGYRILRIGLAPDRAALYQRVNARAAAMFAHGLVEETRDLLARYSKPVAAISAARSAPATNGRDEFLSDPSSPINALGYRQAAQLLRGELSNEQAIAAAQQAHRNYAKRQMTWFRREPDVHWLRGFGDEPAVLSQALALVSSENSALTSGRSLQFPLTLT